MDSPHLEHEATPSAAALVQRDPHQSSRSGPLPRWPGAHEPPTGIVQALPPSHPLPPHWSFPATAFTVFTEIGAALQPRSRQRRHETPMHARGPSPGAGRGLARAVTEAFSEGRMHPGSTARERSGRGAAGRDTAGPVPPETTPPRAGWDHLPEVVVAGLLRQAGADDAEVRRFLTFAAAMNRGQDPDQLWLAALDAFRLAPWAFESKRDAGAAPIAEMLEASKLSVSAPMDALAWRSIAAHLAEPGPISEAVHEGRGDASELLRALEALNPATGAKRFPLLCAPRTAGRWVRMLAVPGRARIAGLERIPLTIDGAVRRAGECLGVTHTRGMALEDVRDHIRTVWEEDVSRHGTVGPAELIGTAAALEPALAFLGRHGCAACERVGRQRPIADVCEGCTLPKRRGC